MAVTRLDQPGQLVPQEQPVADALRHGLLRHRVDGHRGQPARHRAVRGGGLPLQPAAVRPDDRRRPGGDEDAAGAAADLAADARAEVVHFDGGLRLDRRGVRHLLRGAGDRPLHAGGHVRPRLSAAAGAVDPDRWSICRRRSSARGRCSGREFDAPRGSSPSGRWKRRRDSD